MLVDCAWILIWVTVSRDKASNGLISKCTLRFGTAIPQCHRQYWICLKQNKEELIIPPFTEDEFTRILAVAQW